MRILTFLLLLICGSVNSFAQSAADSTPKWSYHFQLTAVNQGHPAFHAKYSGDNSLNNEAERGKLSITTTLFIGRKLWRHAAFYFNPEIAGGSGISAAKGIAGFTNGETFRIGSVEPKFYIARLYISQTFPLKKSGHETVESDINQVPGKISDSRITLTAGKLSMSDFFDGNAYSHDPRTQFLNWSLMSNGAWDYPADTRGYTQGIIVEFIKPSYAVRISSVLVPRKANGLQLDYNIAKAHSETLEIEKNWNIRRPGAIRFLAYRNVSQAPTFSVTLEQVKIGDSSSVDVYTGLKEWRKWGGVKYGFGINAEQEISNSLGAFFKASWNDGRTATWAFTQIDRSMSAGLSIHGNIWERPNDHIGIAVVVNGLSPDHRAFLGRGLYGFIIGDGKLTYGEEGITEMYYQARLFSSFWLAADYQFVNHPACNRDRGPVHVFAIRGHIQF